MQEVAIGAIGVYYVDWLHVVWYGLQEAVIGAIGVYYVDWLHVVWYGLQEVAIGAVGVYYVDRLVTCSMVRIAGDSDRCYWSVLCR